MPLRDHFHEPLVTQRPWQGFHALWPAMILLRLKPLLPEGYRAEPRVQLGPEYEIDIGTLDHRPSGANGHPRPGGGGAAALLTAPPPTFSVATRLTESDEFSVRVYAPGRILVAAVELVSPRNKDRPASRRAFAEKVAELVRSGVSVSVVDVVGNSHFNLYAETLGVIGHADPALGDDPPAIYAVTCRVFGLLPVRLFESWFHPLTVGRPLPTLPLWLHDDLFVNLELEQSYEETCRVLELG
jgi:hypothetical protein